MEDRHGYSSIYSLKHQELALGFPSISHIESFWPRSRCRSWFVGIPSATEVHMSRLFLEWQPNWNWCIGKVQPWAVSVRYFDKCQQCVCLCVCLTLQLHMQCKDNSVWVWFINIGSVNVKATHETDPPASPERSVTTLLIHPFKATYNSWV